MSARRHALVLGGTGAIGSAVLRGLARAKVPATFTYLSNEDKARSLATEHAQRAVRMDLADPAEIRALMGELTDVDVVVACAATRPTGGLLEVTDGDITRALAVTVHAPIAVCREIAKRSAAEPVHVVLVSALHPAQSLPLAVPFAAAQGALAPLAMALAKELGPRGVRVNVVTGGLVGAGMSKDFDVRRVADFERFSALHRLGTAEEIAAPILWLALENTYVSGKVLAANGGI